MVLRNLGIFIAASFIGLTSPILAGQAEGVRSNDVLPRDPQVTLWREPTDIATRDLAYGAGGKEHEPKAPFSFIEEDGGDSNPKFIVEDAQGVRWKAKLGPEVRSETAATRLLWAVGYFTDEDYFVPNLRVQGMKRLSRGQQYIEKDGTVRAVRLERQNKDIKKIGHWNWYHNPFIGTREFTGLKVMMALINNWDLKASNNDIYQTSQEHQYVISDLGATFGRSGNRGRSKGNLTDYARSKFLRKIESEEVDLSLSARPPFWLIFALPLYIQRTRMVGLGNDLPRAHVAWIGHLLSQLSNKQLTDAFRCAGFSAKDVGGFSQEIQERVAELNQLQMASRKLP